MKKVLFLVLATVSRAFANDYTVKYESKQYAQSTKQDTALKGKMKEFLGKFKNQQSADQELLSDADKLELMIQKSEMNIMTESHETEIVD